MTFFEKLCFGVPAVAFAAMGQVPAASAVFGGIDLVLMALFVVAWWKIRRLPA